MKKGDILVVKRSATFRDANGNIQRIRRGQLAEKGAEITVGREHLFEEPKITYPVEVKA